MTLQIALLHTSDAGLVAGEADDAIAVSAVEDAARDVAQSLAANGYEVRTIAVRDDREELFTVLRELRTDLVFNLVESLGGDARREAYFAAALELAGLAYTGPGPRSLLACLEKPMARVLLAARGVRVPRGVALERGDEALGDLRYPLIVKPAREDASHGIELESVVRDEVALRERARYVIERYQQAALVEEYIDGRELNITLLGSGANVRVLPPAEIDFTGFPDGAPRIVTYSGKWVPSTMEYEHTRSMGARELSPEVARAVDRAARDAYSALELCDYGRVDLRLNARGEPHVIDVNPNPDLSKDAGLSLTAQRCGISHEQLISSIVQSALDRAPASARTR